MKQKIIAIEITKLEEGYIIQTQKKRWILYYHTRKTTSQTFESLGHKIISILQIWNEQK